jgi:putative hydrolase of the HAD superfamily
LIDPVGRHADGWFGIVGPRFGMPDMRGFFQPERFGQVVLGRVAVEEALADFFNSIGSDADPVAFLEGWLTEDLCVNEEVASAAEAWAHQGVPIVLATTQEHRRAARLRDLFGERLGLSDVIYSALLGVEKPEPEYFRIADARVRHRPVIFIDDALRNVEAARSHGWTAIHYPHDENWREIVESLLV